MARRDIFWSFLIGIILGLALVAPDVVFVLKRMGVL